MHHCPHIIFVCHREREKSTTALATDARISIFEGKPLPLTHIPTSIDLHHNHPSVLREERLMIEEIAAKPITQVVPLFPYIIQMNPNELVNAIS
jgi:hypothetical protein